MFSHCLRGFEFRILLILDLISTKAREPTLLFLRYYSLNKGPGAIQGRELLNSYCMGVTRGSKSCRYYEDM